MLPTVKDRGLLLRTENFGLRSSYGRKTGNCSQYVKQSWSRGENTDAVLDHAKGVQENGYNVFYQFTEGRTELNFILSPRKDTVHQEVQHVDLKEME